MSLVSPDPIRLSGFTPQEPGKRKIALPVCLTEDVVEAIQAASRGSSGESPLRITFNGREQGSLLVGAKSFPFTRPKPQESATTIRELYVSHRQPSGAAGNPLTYFGLVAPKLEIKRKVDAKTIQKLRDKRAQAEEERRAREIVVLDEEPVLTQGGKKRKAGAQLQKPGSGKKILPPVRPTSGASTSGQARANAVSIASAKASPFAQTKTPNPPTASGTSTPMTDRLVAPLPSRPGTASGSRPSSPDSKLLKRVLCRLADRPLTLAQLAKILGAPPERIKPFLEKVAKPTADAPPSTQQFSLPTASFLQLDWTCPELDKLPLLAKENVAANAQRAYDALGVRKDAKERGELAIFVEKVKSVPVMGLGISAMRASPAIGGPAPAPDTTSTPAPTPTATPKPTPWKPAPSGPTVTDSGISIGGTLKSTFRGGVSSKEKEKEKEKKELAARKTAASTVTSRGASRAALSPDVHTATTTGAKHPHSPAAPSPLAKSTTKFDRSPQPPQHRTTSSLAVGEDVYASSSATRAKREIVDLPTSSGLRKKEMIEEESRRRKRGDPSEVEEERQGRDGKRRKIEAAAVGLAKREEESRERKPMSTTAPAAGKASKPEERKVIARDTVKAPKREEESLERKPISRDAPAATATTAKTTRPTTKDVKAAHPKLEEHSPERKALPKDLAGGSKAHKIEEHTSSFDRNKTAVGKAAPPKPAEVDKKPAQKRKLKTEDDGEDDEYLPTAAAAKKRKTVTIKEERPLPRSKATTSKSVPALGASSSKERKLIEFTDTEEDEPLAKKKPAPAPAPSAASKASSAPPSRAALNVRWHQLYAEYVQLHAVIVEQEDALRRYVAAGGEAGREAEMRDPEETEQVVRKWQALHGELQSLGQRIDAMDKGAPAS